jgi:hypothetical protein
MNRRNFIQAAALSTVTALQIRGREMSLPAVHAAPLEVDLADPDAARHIGNSMTELYVRLEELHPADPGQLSGTFLRVMQSGAEFTFLNAQCAALQPDGSQGFHIYGWLDGAELAYIGSVDSTDETGSFVVRLREHYAYRPDRPDCYSGASLILFAGDDPELQVSFGGHSLGVLRGQLLTNFLWCVRQRCSAAEGLASV